MLRLNADEAHRWRLSAQGDGDAGEQPAAAQGDDDGLHVRALLENFQTTGALTSDDIGVVERGDKDGAGVRGILLGDLDRLVEGVSDLLDFGTVGPGRGNFWHRRT